MSDIIQSIEIENQCLASLLQNQEVIPDYINLVSHTAFGSKVNQTIFSCIKVIYNECSSVDKVVLFDKVRNIGIKNISGIPIEDYIDSLYELNGVNSFSIKKYFQELIKYDIARKIDKKSDELKSWVSKNLYKSLPELVAGTDKIIGECVTSQIAGDFDPIDVYAYAEPFAESIGDEPKEDDIILPFPRMQALYGGFLKGELVVFAMPPKAGKTTLVNKLVRHATLNPNCRALILDTEIKTDMIVSRMIAAEAGIPEAYVRKGKWRLNKKMVENVRALWPKYSHLVGRFEHLYIGNKPIDEVTSMIRRWKATRLKEGQTGLVIYDYLKITGEKLSEVHKEYQVMGEKCDTLKHIAAELDVCCVAPIQTNAMGDVSMTQRIKWFASNVYNVRPKTPDEILEHGPLFGTHILTPVVTRIQGEEGAGFKDYVQVKNDKGKTEFRTNFINLEFNNFDFEEKGTLEDIVARSKQKEQAEEEDEDDPF